MHVYTEELNYPARQHPWTHANHDERGRYYDFKVSPELIPDVIEDLKPFEQYHAIRHLYQILEEVNSPTSPLETNDILFRGPGPNESEQFGKKLQCIGRLALLYRNLGLNCSDDHVSWLSEQALTQLQTQTPTFHWGCIGISTWHTLFTEIQNSGRIVVLRYWAWGDTEGETMDNLKVVVANIGNCLRSISAAILAAGTE